MRALKWLDTQMPTIMKIVFWGWTYIPQTPLYAFLGGKLAEVSPERLQLMVTRGFIFSITITLLVKVLEYFGWLSVITRYINWQNAKKFAQVTVAGVLIFLMACATLVVSFFMRVSTPQVRVVE